MWHYFLLEADREPDACDKQREGGREQSFEEQQQSVDLARFLFVSYEACWY